MTISLTMVLILSMVIGHAKADFVFGEPENLGPNVNSSSGEGSNGLSISADELSIYFDSGRSGGYGNADLWVATRTTKNDDWSTPSNLGSVVNSSAQDNSPSISADGLSLYFSSNRSGAVGGSGWDAMDLWVATRETTANDWGAPSNLGPVVNSSDADYMSHISADGLSLYFSSGRPGGSGQRDLWVTTRETTNDDWSEPVNLGPTVNTSSNERQMWISSDGLMLLLQSDRPKGSGAVDIYMTTRATTNDDWTEPVNIGSPVNISQISDVSPVVSYDGLTLYFSSYNRDGGYGPWDLWQAPIIPIIDLNGDGIVDSADMCIVVDNWGTDNQLCDVGPMPWGDGVVDVQDLIVLSEHLFEEVNDSTLVAHWALDEVEGMFAADSAGDNDAFVVGGAAWQPSGGQVDGAIQLDGVSGCAIAGFALNPADGPFSIIAWIKGGESGQVIMSQQSVANWLTTDAEGNLMTELAGLGRNSGPVWSQTVITDGIWQRIGLVWDGSHRTLYVDGIAVADDIQPGLESSQMGLYIGVGKNYDAGTFFSGLIDDVRIYNRVVSP